jgi:hypothetical protein
MVSLPWTPPCRRCVLSWVRASTEPSVPTTIIAGLPLATQLASLHSPIWRGQLVERLAPTLLPQRSSGVLIVPAKAVTV